MFGDGDLTLRTLKLWSTLEISRVLLVFADAATHVLYPTSQQQQPTQPVLAQLHTQQTLWLRALPETPASMMATPSVMCMAPPSRSLTCSKLMHACPVPPHFSVTQPCTLILVHPHLPSFPLQQQLHHKQQCQGGLCGVQKKLCISSRRKGTLLRMVDAFGMRCSLSSHPQVVLLALLSLARWVLASFTSILPPQATRHDSNKITFCKRFRFRFTTPASSLVYSTLP